MSVATQLKTPTGPSKLPLIGNIHQMREKNILHHYLDFWEEYGDVYALKLGPVQSYVFADPAHLHHILVSNQKNYNKGIGYDTFRMLVGQGLITSEGDHWRQQRRIMQPSFTPKAITQFTNMMSEITDTLLKNWETAAEQNTIINVDDEMLKLTMSIISKAMFGLDLGEKLHDVGQALQYGFTYIADRGMNPLQAPLIIPTSKNQQFKKALKIIDEFIYNRIETGRKDNETDDLLSILIDAQDEETGRTMNKEQLRDEAVSLFFAGFETTARTLTWAWHLLTKHPDVMAKLEQEADQFLNGRLPTTADLFDLTYTRMVTDETLRLYPPTALLGRQAIEDDVIGGYHVPAGTLVVLLVHIAHRHASVWQDPERFDPERFTPENIQSRPKYAYIPFANGPRVCIGNNFALMEMVIAIAMTTNRFRLERITPDTIPYEFQGTTRPIMPLEVKVHKR